MSIVAVQLVHSGIGWGESREGPKTYEQLWRVITNDPAETSTSVKAASGLPVMGDAYPDDASAYVIDRNATRLEDTRLVWEVTISYSQISAEQSENNPINRDPVIRWSSALSTRAIIEDRNGEAVVNSAGDYFDPPPEADKPTWTINIQANLSAVPAGILTYMGAVNNSSFTIDGISIAAETAKIVALEISEVKNENDTSFRTVTLGIAVDPDGWDTVVLDQGLREFVDGELVDIYIEPDDDDDDNKKPERASAPVLLDGEGERLSEPSPENAVFLVFETAPRMSFSSLPGVS